MLGTATVVLPIQNGLGSADTVAEIFGPGSSLKGISAWLEAALDNKEN